MQKSNLKKLHLEWARKMVLSVMDFLAMTGDRVAFLVAHDVLCKLETGKMTPSEAVRQANSAREKGYSYT